MASTLNLSRLQQLIHEKFGTQAAFADKCGVSKQYMSKIMKGVDDPSVERLVQFAEYLDVCVDELLIKRRT